MMINVLWDLLIFLITRNINDEAKLTISAAIIPVILFGLMSSLDLLSDELGKMNGGLAMNITPINPKIAQPNSIRVYFSPNKMAPKIPIQMGEVYVRTRASERGIADTA